MYFHANMEYFLKSVFIFFAFIISNSCHSQYLSSEIMLLLNVDDKKEIEEAERLIAYGDELMFEAIEMERKYMIYFDDKEDYQTDKIHKLSARKLEILKKITRKKIRASNQYGNANVIMIAVLNKNIDKHIDVLCDEEINIILDLSETSTDLLKQSRSIRGESMLMTNELSVYPYLIEADSIDKLALNKLKDAYAIIMKPELIQKVKTLQDSKIQNITNNTKVYYRIQIAASETNLSIVQLKKIYPDLSVISSEYENGWYKYVIRKNFKTYSEAVKYKGTIDVKGAFIRAYINGEKVSVEEAIKQEKN